MTTAIKCFVFTHIANLLLLLTTVSLSPVSILSPLSLCIHSLSTVSLLPLYVTEIIDYKRLQSEDTEFVSEITGTYIVPEISDKLYNRLLTLCISGY